jgi:hypothetical protein
MGIHWDIPFNMDLNINNENQDWKINTVCGEGIVRGKVKEGD